MLSRSLVFTKIGKMDDMLNTSLGDFEMMVQKGLPMLFCIKIKMKNLVCDAGELYYNLRSVRGLSHK